MSEPFRVGFIPGVTPGKWLRTWHERFPGAPLEALPIEAADQRPLLVDGSLDMCFVREPVDRDGLHLIPLYAEVPVVVAAKDHPVAAFDELDVADLAGEHLLQDLASCPEWAAVADEVREGTRVEPAPMSVAQTIEVAASGAGIVIVPMSLARLHHRKDVRYRPVTGVAQSQVGLAWLVGTEDPRVEDFVGVVRGRTARSSRGRPDDDGGRGTSSGSEASETGRGAGARRRGASTSGRGVGSSGSGAKARGGDRRGSGAARGRPQRRRGGRR